MFESRTIIFSPLCRFRNSALIALASLSVISVPLEDTWAGWWSTSSNKKPAEDADPKTAFAAGDLIRKLTKDAKAQEAEGNLEQAIALADRALRVSERSSNNTKLEADISPAATSRYANDLRLKKASQSVSRVSGTGKKPQGESAAGTDKPLPRFKQPVAEINRSGTRTTAAGKTADKATKTAEKATKTVEKSADRKETAKKPQSVASAVPKAAAKAKPVDTAETRRPVIAATETSKPLAKSSKPAVSARKPDEVDDFPVPAQAVAVKRESTPQTMAKESNNVKVASFDEDLVPLVRPKPPQLTASHTAEKKPLTPPAPMKLRRQYATTALAEASQSLEITKPEVASNELANSSREHEQSIEESRHEHNRIVPVAAEEDLVPSTKAPATFDDDFDSTSSEAVSGNPRTRLPQDNFPLEKAREMKRRLETASALEPGAVAPMSTLHGDFAVSSPDDDWNAHRVLKLRKYREFIPQLPAQKVKAAAIERTRQSVVGQTSMVKWRSAKAAATVSERIPDIHSQSDRLPDDLRQSLRETTVSAQTDSPPTSSADKSIETSTARPSHSLDWGRHGDHAPLPAESGSANSKNSANTMTFNMLPPASAPLPPTEIADEHERHGSLTGSFDRHRHAETNFQSVSAADFSGISGSMSIAPLSYSEDAVDNFLGADSSRSTDAAAELKATTMSGKGQSFVRTIAASLLSLLSAAGVVAFMAGLWVLRVVIRSKASKSD